VNRSQNQQKLFWIDSETAIDEAYACYDRLEENPYIYEACREPRLNKKAIAGLS